MASGINATFRQIGIATSVAVLGSIFDSRIRRGHRGDGDRPLRLSTERGVLIAACIAFAAGALALARIRRKDFRAPTPLRRDPSLRPQTTTERCWQRCRLRRRSRRP